MIAAATSAVAIKMIGMMNLFFWYQRRLVNVIGNDRVLSKNAVRQPTDSWDTYLHL